MPNNDVQPRIKEWVNNVRGKVVAEKRRPVYRSVPLSWMTEQEQKVDIVNAIEDETVLVLEIPVRELESMAETQDWYKRNIGGYSMAKFDHLIREKHVEESLRNQHPGLKELWEKYQTMLALCDDETFK